MNSHVPQPDAFDYIVGLQLIIVAIGITKIFEGLSWINEHRKHCVTFWIHTLGSALIGLLLLQYAWTSFFDYAVLRWTFGDFLLQCATPLIYLFVADLLFLNDAPKDCNFYAVYAHRIKLIAGLVMLAQVVNSILDIRYHPGDTFATAEHLIRGGVVVILGGLFAPLPRFKWLHGTILVLLLSALLGFCFFLTKVIEIRGTTTARTDHTAMTTELSSQSESRSFTHGDEGDGTAANHRLGQRNGTHCGAPCL